jgi:hypothetical protein
LIHREWCETCGKVTPQTARRGCKLCRASARRAVRKLRAKGLGSNVARYGDVLRIADELWSAWVRASRDACEMCRVPLHPALLQCAHGYSREDRVIRFDPDNTFALCSGCHRRHTPARQPWYDWMRARLGDRHDRLELASRTGGKVRLSHLQLVILDAEQRIASLPEGDRKAWALERAAKIGERMVRLGVRAA